jgi:hypothetical protein
MSDQVVTTVLDGIRDSSLDLARRDLGVIATKMCDKWVLSVPDREAENK